MSTGMEVSMNRSIMLSKFIALISVCFGILLFFSPLSITYAKQGCCSDHGGVAGCNKATRHQLCKDGTDSPTCDCSGATISTTKSTKGATKNTGIISTLFGTSKGTKETTKGTTGVTTTATTTTKTTGCCSGHGGVGKCDSKSGYLKCKDGTLSTTCACAKKAKATKATKTKKTTTTQKTKMKTT